MTVTATIPLAGTSTSTVPVVPSLMLPFFHGKGAVKFVKGSVHNLIKWIDQMSIAIEC